MLFFIFKVVTNRVFATISVRFIVLPARSSLPFSTYSCWDFAHTFPHKYPCGLHPPFPTCNSPLLNDHLLLLFGAFSFHIMWEIAVVFHTLSICIFFFCFHAIMLFYFLFISQIMWERIDVIPSVSFFCLQSSLIYFSCIDHPFIFGPCAFMRLCALFYSASLFGFGTAVVYAPLCAFFHIEAKFFEAFVNVLEWDYCVSLVKI